MNVQLFAIAISSALADYDDHPSAYKIVIGDSYTSDDALSITSLCLAFAPRFLQAKDYMTAN